MYVHWADMEIAEQNWGGAIESSDLGFSQCKDYLTRYEELTLGNAKAFATSQIGKRLWVEAHRQRAIEHLQAADRLLRQYIGDPDHVPQGAWWLHSRLFNALIQNDEALYSATGDMRWFDTMMQDLRRWEAEHAGDTKLQVESRRVRRTYASLIGQSGTNPHSS